jgi:tape measure domain-containing protein
MTTIDENVVSMKFDNKEFESGIKTTLASLDILKKSLNFEGATKGLEGVSTAAKNLDLSNIASGVNTIADHFRALSVVAITALANITTEALHAGSALVKSLTIDPIKSGLEEYQTNINSIQTILSNTRWQNTGLNDVNDALNKLNIYSDQTIYNFSQMAHNIGTFTSAGVKLDVAVNAIKGIANLAAVSGSNAEQASMAMYQLSQAIATGTVRLIDWNSVVNAGLGGKVFQDALIETARVHKISVDSMIKDAGSFRASLEQGWLTASVLTETLSHFTGDLNEQQLIGLGYNKQQALSIVAMGKDAADAATKVKTITQLLNTLRESAGSGWAQTWGIVFGNFEEARTLFTDVNNVLGEVIQTSASTRNQLLQDWKDLGGRQAIIDAISNSFHALIAVVKPIRDAFREIFPAITGKQLADLSYLIRAFTDELRIGSETADKLRRTFAGVFAIFGIGWDIVKEVVKTLAKLFGLANQGSGDILTITANIGDFLVELRKAIQEGHAIEKVFGVIGNVLAVPVKILKALAGYAAHLFDGFDAQNAVKAITGVVGKLEPLSRLGDVIVAIWTRVINVLGIVAKDASKLGDQFAALFGDFGGYVSEALQGLNFTDVLHTIQTGFFGALLVMLHNIIGRGGVTGLLHTITGSFSQLTDTMQSMQNTLRAATLLEIAVAIGILTVSVNTLSKIDSAGLTRSLTAMTVMFGQLVGTLAIFEKMSGFAGLAKMPLVTAGLILLALAVDLLASAVKKLADLNWNQLTKGLTGVTVLIGAVVLAVRLMPPSPGIVASSAALILLAGAIRILVFSVTALSGMSWEEMAKGLTGVAALLLALGLFTKFAAANAAGVLSGAGIVLLATGIKILASAMQDFAGLSWEQIGKGLVAMAGGLVLMGAALTLIPPTAPITAAGIFIAAASLGMLADALGKMGGMSWSEIGKGLTVLAGALTLIGLALTLIPPTAPLVAAGILIVAVALGMITDALGKMGGMSWTEIAKGLVTLAGALTIITLAMIFMTGALPGAAALLVVAGALLILAPILQMFGQMSWSEIVKGLATLAGVFLVIGIAGALLTPVIPTLLGLGVAIALIGVGLLAAGVGILAFSLAVTALSISGAALVTTIVSIVAGLVGLIPTIAKEVGLGLVVIAGVIANSGEAITQAIVAILLALLNAIIKVTPVLGEAILKLVLEILDVLEAAVPRLLEVGIRLILALLKGIRDNIREITVVAGDILVNFIKGMQDNQPKVLKAGVDFIISFIENLAKTIRGESERLGAAGGDLATAIIEGMAKGLLGGANKVAKAARDVAKQALNAAKDFLGIASPSKEAELLGAFTTEGMAIGIIKTIGAVTKASATVGDETLKALRKSLSDVSSLVGADMDTRPVISPVLDLSGLKNSASQIGTILSQAKPIDLSATFTKAKDVSAGVQDNKDATQDPDATTRDGNLTFNQYNNSPKALPAAEIYRQTNNQLSVARKAVAP